jgi:CubicO group peptidase (beta-lactamase class C family)
MIRFAVPRDPGLVYSNFGYNVAAMVIDAKRPEGWKRYLDSAIHRPVGMTETYTRVSGLDRRRIATTHDLRPDGNFVTTPFFKVDATMNSAGGHLATLRDLARWVTVQMDSGVLDGRRVFPARAVALSHTLIAPQTRDQSRRFAVFDRAGWSAGWDIGSYEGEPMVSRFGGYSSTRSHLSFLPRRRIGVVAQTNGQPGGSVTDIIAALAYDLEAGRPNARQTALDRLQSVVTARARIMTMTAQGDSVRASRQRPLDRPLTDFAGSYWNDQYGTISFQARDGKLHFRWGALFSEAEVLDAGRNVLRVIVGDGGTAVAFTFPGSGPASSIEMRGQTFARR